MKHTNTLILFSFSLWVLVGCGEKGEHAAEETDNTIASDSDSATEIDSATEVDTETDTADSITFYDESSIFATPEQFLPWIESFADFWMGVIDEEDGGFYTFVDEQGNPTANTNKSVVTQSRDAWGFSRAFMISGDETYLDYAEHALNFLTEHAWDQTNDGWFYELTKDGTPSTSTENNRKWSFGQHYALLGFTGLVEATQDSSTRQWLQTGWNSNETHMWDDDPIFYGYYAEADADWSNPVGKGFTPTLDGITTNVLSTYLGANHDAARTRLVQLGDNIYERILTPETSDAVKFGIAEEYDTPWDVLPQSTFGYIGHILKTAWCLARAHLVTEKTDTAWLDRARELIVDVWDNGGYDHEYGGPYTGTTWNTGWVNTTHKEYWQVEQAVTAGLLNFHTNPDNEYRAIFLEMAEESMQFFMDHFIDQTYGEIYLTVEPNGTVLNATKGDIFKSAYHGIETMYYAYIYGSLFYKHAPVTLYYRFLPEVDDLNVKLTPCAVENELLVIDSVELDGAAYNDFESAPRTLHVPAGAGGIFKVTYRMVDSE